MTVRVLNSGVQRTVSLGPPLTAWAAPTACAASTTITTASTTWDVSDADFVWVFCTSVLAGAGTGVVTFSFVCSGEEGSSPRFPTITDFTITVTSNGATLASSGALVDVRATRALKVLSVANADAGQAASVQAYCADKVPRTYPV